MIPLAVPNLNGREREYLNQCIDTTFVSSVGPFVERLEALTAELAGTRYGVATSSGTTGLHLALTGYGVVRDDLVIIPSFTFIATANAVAHCGAMPWFMDIEPDTWTIDAAQLERELEEKTEWQGERLIHKETGRRVAVIMLVYTLGNIPDMDRIRAIAKEWDGLEPWKHTYLRRPYERQFLVVLMDLWNKIILLFVLQPLLKESGI